MRLEMSYGKALVLGGCLAAIGCSAGVPSTTQATQPHLYQVQAVNGDVDIGNIVASLPQRISQADATRLLVHLDPSQIRTTPSYSLQFTGVGHHDWMRSNGLGWISAYNGVFAPAPITPYAASNFVYYRYDKNYMFPYVNSGTQYSPYTTASCTQPYLYGTTGVYSPYTFINNNCTSVLSRVGETGTFIVH